MHRRAFLVLLGCALTRPTPAAAGSATQVSVLDAEFRSVKVITIGPDLAAFNAHWAAREVTADAAMQPDYKIDIQDGARSERWLYDPAGLARVLSKQTSPIYRLASPSAFNALLGITPPRAP